VTTRVAVLVSGNGSNLQAVIDASEAGELDIDIVAVVANVDGAYGLERARRHAIPTEVVLRHDDPRPVYDQRLAEVVASHQPELVVLAGWMRILTQVFLDRFPVLNLHPALPGMFPGVKAIERAFLAWQDGDISATGVMVHWVPDEGVDVGPVVAHTDVPFLDGDSLETFSARVHEVEHRLLVDAIDQVISGSAPGFSGSAPGFFGSAPVKKDQPVLK
jgi:phosphoribosylglycinamide formyltransferase 1